VTISYLFLNGDISLTWPNPSDYQDTVQNPKVAFSDTELCSGVVAVNKLGLPRVASGNFASVYEIRSGSQRYAVRCLLRQVSDQQQRYERLSRHLAGLSLPSLVDFEYLEHGIRVHARWYPVVKMEWVEGVSLHKYVEQNLHNPAVLGKLAARWRGLVNSLRGSRLAHGDLQHGNVLVTASGDMKLVDYDGMFVPALHGQHSNELGHANYQHPKREAGDYDERLDAFAALVIYLSLRAVVGTPELWPAYHNGDNLLFKNSDLIRPDGSPLFTQLLRSRDPIIVALTELLTQACMGALAVVPDLENAIHTSEGVTLPTFTPPLPSNPTSTATNHWWKQSGSPVVTPPSMVISHSSPVIAPQSAHPPRKLNQKDGAALIFIPAGEFVMGDKRDYNNPFRKVMLSDYYIYEKPVTVGQYRKFIEEVERSGKQINGNGGAMLDAKMPDFPPEDHHPIVDVSWYAAEAYAAWAGVRLPTEAEWEKAARGTDGRKFPWGEEFDDSKLWSSVNVKRTGTAPAGFFTQGASPYGVLDMAGNVKQWCSDYYTNHQRRVPLIDPTGPSSGYNRVVRNSTWKHSEPFEFESSERWEWNPIRGREGLGFRCVRWP
jgi:formylglycine-generating enzyme required for sulfatase activity